MDKILIQDLAEGLANRKGISRNEAEAFVRNAFEVIKEYLLSEGTVKVKGLGTFKLITVGSRESVNVNTGERFTIDSHAKVTFTPDPVLRDRVNKPFADFETVVLNDETKTEDMERIDMEPVQVADETSASETEKLGGLEPEPAVSPLVGAAPSEPQPETPQEEPAVEPQPEPEPVAASSETSEPEPVAEPKEEPQPESETPQEEPKEEVKPKPKESETETSETGGSKKWLWCLLLLLLLLLLGWWLLAGKKGGDATEEVLDEPTVVYQDTIAETRVPAEPVKSAEELAADYPQIEGGEYWIVGTKATHVLQRGDDLSKLALEHYGDKHLINYIIKFNGYGATQASNLYVGTEVKLPELVRKD